MLSSARGESLKNSRRSRGGWRPSFEPEEFLKSAESSSEAGGRGEGAGGGAHGILWPGKLRLEAVTTALQEDGAAALLGHFPESVSGGLKSPPPLN